MKFLESIAKNARSIIAFGTVFLAFGFLYALLLRKIPEGNETVLNVASGIVLGVLGMVCSYYFGSSKDKSDQEKADILKDGEGK